MRYVPPALQAHLDSGATTVTLLARIAPVTDGYEPFGITALDRDVPYDDGDGPITYAASIGMVPSNMVSTLEMEVNNSEIQHLVPKVPQFNVPLTEVDIVAGAYDFAEFVIYLVNYEDLSMGHVILASGQLGQMRVVNGLSFFTEQTGQTKPLMQSIVQKDSITCRATFGSQYPGTPGDSVKERQPCGFDAESLFVPGTVSAVGSENKRTLTASDLGQADGYFVPGMIRWLSGRNFGRSYEVEEFAGGVADLTFRTMFPIEVGDTFEIRPDCTKRKDGANGCKYFWGVPEWKLHYRGEPNIPVSDAVAQSSPGADVGPGGGTVPETPGGTAPPAPIPPPPAPPPPPPPPCAPPTLVSVVETNVPGVGYRCEITVAGWAEQGAFPVFPYGAYETPRPTVTPPFTVGQSILMQRNTPTGQMVAIWTPGPSTKACAAYVTFTNYCSNPNAPGSTLTVPFNITVTPP